VAIGSERLKTLHVAKLRALLGSEFGEHDIHVRPSPHGAFAVSNGVAFALLEKDCELGLGAALAFTIQQDADTLQVFAADHSAIIARQASYFDFDVIVSTVSEGGLPPAVPATFVASVALDASAERFALVLAAAGADVVVEHGVMRGEVMGLEIARVLVEGDGPRLEVGVGRNDREAFSMLYQHMTAAEALTKVVATVAEHRAAGAENHALNLMAVERWLRAIVIAQPDLVDARNLSALAPVLPRPFVDSAGPAAAVGVALSGEPVVAVCSVGIDLSLVPLAADLRAQAGRNSILQIVLPQRDMHPVTVQLLELLHGSYRITPVANAWRDRGTGAAAVR